MSRKVRYITEGNTIKKIYEFPEQQRIEKEKIRSNPHRRTYRNNETAPRMSLKMTLILAASVLISVTSCINYLNTQSEITEIKSNISSLEKSIETLATRNDSIEYELDSIDVEYIMKVATEELGMVMVQENQIVTYDSTRNEYMEQYSDVPEK